MSSSIEARALESATRTAATLFGLGALPAFLAAGDQGTIALAAGLGLAWACTVAPLPLRRRMNTWKMATAAPILRVGLALVTLFGLLAAGAPQHLLESMALVLGLTYPVFLIQSAVLLAEDVQTEALEGVVA